MGTPITANVPADKSSTFALTDLINDRWPAMRGNGAFLNGIGRSPETLFQSHFLQFRQQ